MFRDNSGSRLNEVTRSRLGCKIVVGVARKGGFKGMKCCGSLPSEMKELPVAVERDSMFFGDGNLQKCVCDGMMLKRSPTASVLKKAEKITDVEN